MRGTLAVWKLIVHQRRLPRKGRDAGIDINFTAKVGKMFEFFIFSGILQQIGGNGQRETFAAERYEKIANAVYIFNFPKRRRKNSLFRAGDLFMGSPERKRVKAVVSRKEA